MKDLKKYFNQIFLVVLIISVFFSTQKTLSAKPDVEEIQLIIIVPINTDYDESPLKQLDSSLMDVIFTDTDHTILAEPSTVSAAYSTDSKEYLDYMEIYTTYSDTGEMLIDGEGFYYPTVTEIIGTGDQEELITLNTTLVDYYMIDETGEVATDGETPYARVYSVVIESNNVSINEKNVKYELAFRSYDTMEEDGVIYDVQHVVVSEIQDWVRLSESTVSLTDQNLEAGDYTAVINGMSRTYLTAAPVFDNSLGVPVWDYYQDPGKISLFPTTPQEDYDCFSLTETLNGSSSTVNTLYLINNTNDFSVSIEGKLISTDAVYFSFVNSEYQVDITDYYLNNLTIDIYMSDGTLDGYSGIPLFSDIRTEIGVLIYDFAFNVDYNSLLNTLTDSIQDSFDIVLTGTANNGKSVTVILDNIKLPTVRINSLTITNNTTEKLWESMGLSSELVERYSTANFINTGDSVADITAAGDGTDGNYAKEKDSITISLSYNIVSDSKYTFDDSIELLFNGLSASYGTKSTNLYTGEINYTFSLNNFSGNGVAYINAGTVTQDSERIKILYIDNKDPDSEFASITPTYINDSTYQLYYSCDEEGKGDTEEHLTTGYTGTRAYIDVFSYDSAQSDIEAYNANYGLSITGVPHNGTFLSNEKYCRVIFGYSGNVIVDETGHTNDGRYQINKVIAVDKAGNVQTENKTNVISIALQADVSSTAFEYYVDTISPILSASLEKTQDFYTELNDVFNLPAAVAFKNGDLLEIQINATDYNLDTYSVSEDTSIDLTDSYSFPVSDTPILTFTVESLSDSAENYQFFTATATDKAGNSSTEPLTGQIINTAPSNVKLEIYEDYKINWVNSSTGISGSSLLEDPTDTSYRFSKGALFSNTSKPDIYITGGASTSIDTVGDNRVQVLALDINGETVYYNYGDLSPDLAVLNLADINYSDPNIDDFYLTPNSKNTMDITPYGISGVKGNLYTENIVIDTDVNSDVTIMSTGVYIPSSSKYQFELDFSNISELAGLAGYKVNKIDTKTNTIKTTYDNSSSVIYTDLSTTPSTTLIPPGGLTGTIEVDKTDVIPGSRSTLYVDLLDALGSEKQVKFTLLIPEPTISLKAKTSGSDRVMTSYVKVVGDSNNEKGFEIESIEE